ncbi:glycosylphosphatidylinositol anchor biosynthesis, partial [Spiromyces aspiralis]
MHAWGILLQLAALVAALSASCLAADNPKHEEKLREFFTKDGHTNNWAVLMCTSRFWFNYRHISNTLAMYRTVKRLGIPDSNIILMLADDMACNPRNKLPAAVYSHPDHDIDIYGENVEVDYRGYEVTVENFIRMMTGRVTPDTPRNKRLLTDDKSNIFFYLTGHGGEDFLKFQDAEEINSQDIADAFAQMRAKRRYNEILFMADTCQANTLYSRFKSPNVLSVGSSELGQNSYSYFHDPELGLTVVDRFTYVNLKYFEGVGMQSTKTFADLFSSYDTKVIRSNPRYDSRWFGRRLNE